MGVMKVLSVNDPSLPDIVRATEHFRQAVVSGEYVPGDKLPTLVEGAEMLGVHRLTVAEAYKRLCKDGLVELRRSVGAFVKDRSKASEHILFLGFPNVKHSYTEDLGNAMVSYYEKKGLSVSMRFVDRAMASLPPLLKDIQSLAKTGTLRGVWMVNLSHEWVLAAESLLGPYHVPLVHLSNRRAAMYSVGIDSCRAVREGARWLVAQGCGNIALIAQGTDVHQENEEAFRATCEAMNVKCRIDALPFSETRTAASFELHGKEAVKRLMADSAPPDGLLIADDVIGRGALATLMQLRVRVPEDVRICTHSRKGDAYPFVFGMPVARFEWDAAGQAQLACDMMERLQAKEEVTERHVRQAMPLIVPGEGEQMRAQKDRKRGAPVKFDASPR